MSTRDKSDVESLLKQQFEKPSKSSTAAIHDTVFAEPKPVSLMLTNDISIIKIHSISFIIMQ